MPFLARGRSFPRWPVPAALGVGAVGLGVGLMYLFDPDSGRRRRREIAKRAGRVGRRSRVRAEQPEDIPSLQGGARPGERRSERPGLDGGLTVRVLTAVSAGSLIGYGVTRRDRIGAGLGTAGAALAAVVVAGPPIYGLLPMRPLISIRP